jgi:hypothetical protein
VDRRLRKLRQLGLVREVWDGDSGPFWRPTRRRVPPDDAVSADPIGVVDWRRALRHAERLTMALEALAAVPPSYWSRESRIKLAAALTAARDAIDLQLKRLRIQRE